MRRKKEEKQEGWKGANAVVRRTDGQVLAGIVQGHVRSCRGSALEILCEWGKATIPQDLIAEVHFS